MITPRFKLTQDESTVTITIRAPYCNLRELDVSVEDHVFIFFTSPYYLRLHLPGKLIDNESSKSSFDADSGEFTFSFPKENNGEHFPDLDLITKLMCPKIEVSAEDGNENKIIVLTGVEDKQKSPTELDQEFGFALAGKNNFLHVSAEFQDVFEIDPREVSLKERRKLRLQYEQGKFNIDHYLGDFFENEEIQEICALNSPWRNLKIDDIKFTDEELDFLKDLPNVEYGLTDIQITYCHCSLIDILYAYCYNQRTTHFEGTSESGWTIIKLASSFCWLDAFNNPKEALVSCYRRSVIYPLYRNFDLSQKVFTDLKELLKLGEIYIIKCLIEMYHIFLKGDCCRYIINNLFIKDYIVYIMKWDKERWKKLVNELETIVVEKRDLGLNLEEIEDDVVNGALIKLSNLNLEDSDDTDLESDSSTDSDDSSSINDSSSSSTSCDE